MVGEIVMIIYSYTLLEIVLDIAAVIYSYRLTKITGAFRGWILMILAVVLITVQGTSSILTLALFFPEAQLESLVASVGIGTIIQGAVVGVSVSACLFAAMFELHRTFARLQAAKPA